MNHFEHEGIVFREIKEEDLETLCLLRNDFSTWVRLGDPRILKQGLQKKWLENLNASSDRFYFIAEADGEFLGLIRMDEYDVQNRSLRIGADVVPFRRAKGWGNRIFSAIEKYAFDYLGVHRLWLLVLETNGAAMRLYNKRGFREEGRMRKAIFREGAWRDYVMMSLLEDEYRGKK